MAALKGNNVEVTVIEVDPDFKKIVLSMSRAVQYKQLRAIHLGALMWGEVRRVEEFGAFVGLDGTRISGLLHVSNISRSRVESVAVSLTAYLPEYFARVKMNVKRYVGLSNTQFGLHNLQMLVFCQVWTLEISISELWHVCNCASWACSSLHM